MQYKYVDIVKEILKTLEKSLLVGRTVEKDEIWTARFGVSEKCMVSIFEELVDSGYIKGGEIKVFSGVKTLIGLDKIEITLSGAEHLKYMEE